MVKLNQMSHTFLPPSLLWYSHKVDAALLPLKWCSKPWPSLMPTITTTLAADAATTTTNTATIQEQWNKNWLHIPTFHPVIYHYYDQLPSHYFHKFQNHHSIYNSFHHWHSIAFTNKDENIHLHTNVPSRISMFTNHLYQLKGANISPNFRLYVNKILMDFIIGLNCWHSFKCFLLCLLFWINVIG